MLLIFHREKGIYILRIFFDQSEIKSYKLIQTVAPIFIAQMMFSKQIIEPNIGEEMLTEICDILVGLPLYMYTPNI